MLKQLEEEVPNVVFDLMRARSWPEKGKIVDDGTSARVA